MSPLDLLGFLNLSDMTPRGTIVRDLAGETYLLCPEDPRAEERYWREGYRPVGTIAQLRAKLAEVIRPGTTACAILEDAARQKDRERKEKEKGR